MKSFVNFYKSYTQTLLQEAALTVEGSIDTLVGGNKNSAIFAMMGREYIESKFDEFRTSGAIPTQKKHMGKSKEASKEASSKASKEAGTKRTVNVYVPTDVEPSEEAEMLTFLFKYVDTGVKNDIEAEIKKMMDNTYSPYTDPSVTKNEQGNMVDADGKPVKFDKEAVSQVSKLNTLFQKNYKGHITRPVTEDNSQIKSILQNWVNYKQKKVKGVDVPAEISTGKINLHDLEINGAKLVEDYTGQAEMDADIRKGGPDANIPDGMTFIKEVNHMRLYKWSNTGNLFEYDPVEKSTWLSQVKAEDGSWTDKWCIADKSTAMSYGAGDGYSGNSTEEEFKYPYYLIRKKSANGVYMPYVMMHGQSLQCKDDMDVAIKKDMAEEILPVIEDDLERIVYGDEGAPKTDES